MTLQRLLAQMTVTDLASATGFYTGLFGRGPDANPMPGLLEWRLGESFGVQVWEEAARAGHSSMVFDDSDLEARARLLDAAGLAHDGIQDATTVRILPLVDPDGNRIVFTGPLRSSVG